MSACVRFFKSPRIKNYFQRPGSQSPVTLGMMVALVCDTLNLILESMKKQSHAGFITLSLLPTGICILGLIIRCCKPISHSATDGAARKATSFLFYSAYLFTRSLGNFCYSFFKDYNEEMTTSAAIESGVELGADAVYMLSFFLSKRVENCMKDCLSDESDALLRGSARNIV